MLRKSTMTSQNTLSGKYQARQMSLQGQQKLSSPSLVQKSKKQQKQNKVQQVQYSQQTIRYHELVKLPFGNASDTTLLYRVVLTANSKIRKRHIVLKNTQYVISNWTADSFPNVIYICLDGYTVSPGSSGYSFSKVDSQGASITQTTNRVAALQLIAVQASLDESDVRTYELRYSLKDSVAWQLPLTLLDLKFRLKIDDSTDNVTLPLPNPMVLNIQVRQDSGC